MDVEGVAPRGAVRPSRFGERIPADHGPVTLEQCRRESRLDGRQRHPARPGAQDTVDGARLLKESLMRKGWRVEKDLKYFEAEGAKHNERAWAERFEQILEFLFPARI